MCGVVAIKPDQLRDLTDQQGVPRLLTAQNAWSCSASDNGGAGLNLGHYGFLSSRLKLPPPRDIT